MATDDRIQSRTRFVVLTIRSKERIAPIPFHQARNIYFDTVLAEGWGSRQAARQPVSGVTPRAEFSRTLQRKSRGEGQE